MFITYLPALLKYCFSIPGIQPILTVVASVNERGNQNDSLPTPDVAFSGVHEASNAFLKEGDKTTRNEVQV